jgi:hypothetical protein
VVNERPRGLKSEYDAVTFVKGLDTVLFVFQEAVMEVLARRPAMTN